MNKKQVRKLKREQNKSLKYEDQAQRALNALGEFLLASEQLDPAGVNVEAIEKMQQIRGAFRGLTMDLKIWTKFRSAFLGLDDHDPDHVEDNFKGIPVHFVPNQQTPILSWDDPERLRKYIVMMQRKSVMADVAADHLAQPKQRMIVQNTLDLSDEEFLERQITIWQSAWEKWKANPQKTKHELSFALTARMAASFALQIMEEEKGE